MAEDDTPFAPDDAAINRARIQGAGVGRLELDRQREASREEAATSADRTQAFDADLEASPGEDRPTEADFGDTDVARSAPG